MQMAAEEQQPERARPRAGVSLLFAAGERPSVRTIDRLLVSPDAAGPTALISHRPPEAEGWLELLVSGLTFELRGLAPAPSAPVVAPRRRFGLPPEIDHTPLEAMALVHGPHIAAGRGMLPVVRAMTGLAANLMLLLPTRAVCWEPAESWMEPGYFARTVVSWLAGGPFPALGLTTLDRHADGRVESLGLAFFSGQEIRVEPRPGESPADTAKLAVRLIDHIARHGPIERFTELDSPSGEVIHAEPSHDSTQVRIWRNR